MQGSSANDRGLISDLRRALEGEVYGDWASRALYRMDASNYLHEPIAVVLPSNRDDVLAAFEIARRHEVPVLSRGAGTSLAGQACNAAVVIDFSRHMHRVLEFQEDRRSVRVEPGLVLDDLQHLTRRVGLEFGPDPATHDRCTIGGMLGNNSCGRHSLSTGTTAANVESMTVLTYDGEVINVGPTPPEELARLARRADRVGQIYSRLEGLVQRAGNEIRTGYPQIPRRISGFNLDQLLPENGFNLARALVGTEGTCVCILDAVLRLVHSPPCRRVAVIAYEDVYLAARAVPRILELRPLALEGFDDVLLENARLNGISPHGERLLPAGGGWLLVEVGSESDADCADAIQNLRAEVYRGTRPLDFRELITADDMTALWHLRESGLGASARVPGHRPSWPGWEDSAVRPDQLEGYLRELRLLLDRFEYRAPLYGHFGEACIHPRIDFDLKTTEGISKFRRFLRDAAELCVKYGGSLSGEHGDGQARAALYPLMFSGGLIGAFEEFKNVWDPDNKMNPGRLVRAREPEQDLRLVAMSTARLPKTVFPYAADERNLLTAVQRCVGVGRCRKTTAGVMCPSYMVTKDERHSTRGRAHLLEAMLVRGPADQGWRDQNVKEALDLCFSCKACKTECPVGVDMATYKAEFLARFYSGRLRPVGSYVLGLSPWLIRIGSPLARLLNATLSLPGLERAIKRLLGFAQERPLPRLAPLSFRRWFRRHGGERRRPESPRHRVLLWIDTFNNYLSPDIARAAVEVLEDAGCEVALLPRERCCGRPLYDQGMLRLAKRVLRTTVRKLQPWTRDGWTIVGLEPSCVAVFRDELTQLFPGDVEAEALSQRVRTLSEFLVDVKYVPPTLPYTAMVQMHCHELAVLRTNSVMAMLERVFEEVSVLDSGCCGMAGGFGFDEKNYPVGIRAAERVLFPAVRSKADRVMIADGYSCREQIAHGTGVRALHSAEALRLAIRRRGRPGK